ncbi:MAG: HlyD family efflux transporter periplasmic adaptor subunit [Paeniclostridium sp.]
MLKNQKQTYYTDYKAPISGVALFKYDKNFNISVDQLDDIDSKMLDSIENNFISIDKKDHKVSQDDVVLRLIDLNQVYICIFQDKNKEIFKEGQDVKVVVNDSEIDAKVEKYTIKK